MQTQSHPLTARLGAASRRTVQAAPDRRPPARLVLLPLLAFVVLAVLAHLANRTLLRVDEPLSTLVRGEAHLGLWRTASMLGSTEVAVIVALLVSAVTWLRCRAFALLYPAVLVAGSAVNVALKLVVGRTRPPSPDTVTALASFPSGHAFQATILLGLLPLAVGLFTQRRFLVWPVTALAGLGVAVVGLSRIRLGAHWPTDVIGGVLVGSSMVLAAGVLLDRHRSRATCACSQVPVPARA